MKHLAAFISLASAMAVLVLFSSCTYSMNIGNEPVYKWIVGKPVLLKRPMNLNEIDFNLNGYTNRHDLGSQVGGIPLVGTVPAGHKVLFERAVRKRGPSATSDYLEGSIDFQGRSYP